MIELKITAILKGVGYVEFFTSLHRHSQPIQLTVKGWFVEISSDDIVYAVVEDEYDEEPFLEEDRQLKRIAREELGRFVRQERKGFPHELLGVDERVDRFDHGDWEGLIDVIAGEKSAETGGVD